MKGERAVEPSGTFGMSIVRCSSVAGLKIWNSVYRWMCFIVLNSHYNSVKLNVRSKNNLYLCSLYRALWYNYVTHTNKMHTFQINVFNSCCLLHVSNIMCSSSGRPFVCAVLYGMFFMRLCKQFSRWMCSILYQYSIEHIRPPFFFLSFSLSFYLLIVVTNKRRRTSVDEGSPHERTITSKTYSRLVYVEVLTVWLLWLNRNSVYSCGMFRGLGWQLVSEALLLNGRPISMAKQSSNLVGMLGPLKWDRCVQKRR